MGHAGPAIYRPHQIVKHPVQDSVIQDWDAAERLIAYAVNDGLRLRDLSENPLLVTEAAWTPKENREKMLELAFEKFQTPAYYSVDRAVVSA
jgi:actin-related protein 4